MLRELSRISHLMASLFQAWVGRTRTTRALVMGLLFPAIALGSTLLLTSVLSTNHTFTVYGPVDYVRGAGKPVAVSNNFAAARGAYILRIYNGGKNGQYGRSSSATVTLNNVQVATPSDFNQKVTYSEKNVTLTPQNTLTVVLNSAPNSGITIEIAGVDNDPPTISAVIDPQPNASGWNKSNVQVSFNCADALSGIGTCSPPVTVLTDGAGQMVTGTATDRAGNSASTTVRLNVDKTPPAVSTTLNPAPNANGWNKTNVTVSFNCSDNLSGVASCSAPEQVTQEGVNQIVNGAAVDVAGNMASTSAHLNVDKTAPTIAISSPGNGTTTNANVINVTGTVNDSRSGVASLTCNGAPASITGGAFICSQNLNEGGNAISLQAIDLAGNVASASINVMRDSAPPVIHLTSPANLATINAPTTDVSGTVDDPSATVTVNGTAVALTNGAFTATNIPLQIGSNVITVTATDPAGNTSNAVLNVTRQGSQTGPFISAISPAGAHFGDFITIRGGGFGNDPHAVKIRFSFDYGSGVYVVDQPVFSAADDNLKVAVPFAVPERTNLVSVLVNKVTTTPVPYDVGSLPVDPTPDQAGNEAVAFVSDIDELITRFDSRLDSWFVESQTLSQAETDKFHNAMAQFHLVNQQFRGQIQSMDAQSLHVLDTLVSTQFMTLEHDQLRQAIAALDGSPLGSRLCEGNDLNKVLDDILKTIEIITDVVHEFAEAAAVVCTIATIIDVITLGAATPLTAIVCTGAFSTVLTIVQTLNDILNAAAKTAQQIVEAAPISPIDGTYTVEVRQEGWPDKPDFVYVNGIDPVVVRAFNDFDNPQCNIPHCSPLFPNCDVNQCDGSFGCVKGCPINFDVNVLGFPVSFSTLVHYNVAPHLNVISDLTFSPAPDGEPFRQVFDNESGETRFTGNDVNRQAGNDRGTYEVTVSSKCGAHGPLLYRVSPRSLAPYYTFQLRLVGGPVFTQITPQQAQLGDQIKVCGDPAYVPPQISQHNFVDFGDTQAELTLSSLRPPCFSATVPDTAHVSGNVSLFVNGVASSAPQPFTVLPPTLNTVNPNPAFAGEPITLTGTGFAADPANNHLQAGGVDVHMISQNGNQIVFELGNATGGPLQLTAASTHVSNDLPFNVMSWGNPTRLSNPNRDADKPALAVLPDGSAGVAWMDRNHAGGQTRLLFADAKPGDASFRSPIPITTDLAGLTSAPQKPALAAGADGRFHLIWVNKAGEIRMASFGRGELQPGDQLITAPPAGFVFKDPAIAVLANTINISVTEVPTSGDFNFVLAQTVSPDGGTTFGALTTFAGPTPLLGEISLTTANGRMWRAFTKSDGPDQYDQQRVIFTQYSADGVAWSAPASPDNKYSADYSIYVADERPSISGDGAGAVVVWDSPQDLVDKFVWGNAEPYNTAGRMLVPYVGYWQFPNTGRVDEDGERPTVAMDSKGIAYAAWLRRDVGTSADGISGVPHIHFNRTLDRFATLQFTPDQTPTHPAGDTTTIDNRPSLAIDAQDNLHMVWLEGTAGNRLVRYLTTASTSYADSLVDDPPLAPVPTRELIAVSTENDSGNDEAPFNGTLLLDPNNPNELRWIAMSVYPPQVAPWNGARGPSFKPNSASVMLSDNQHYAQYLPLESDLGDELIPPIDVASTVHQTFGQPFPPYIDRAMWTPGGRIMAVRARYLRGPQNELLAFFPLLFWSDASDPRFLIHSVSDPVLHSEDNPDASHDGQFFAYERREKDAFSGAVTETLRIAQFQPYTELASINDGYYPSWSPSSNTVVFVKIDPTTQENTLVAYGSGGANALVNPGGEIQWPNYRPDGGDIAFQQKPAGANWTIRLTSGGVVPTPAGYDDTRPVWSPDGQSIVFIRTEKATQSSQLMRWDINAGVISQLTNLPNHVVLGGAERQCVPHFGFGSFPCYPGRPAWVRVPQ